MTRPHIIRADTLDLQDKTSPTAQDHSKHPKNGAPHGAGSAAPHQAAAVRNVKTERSAEDEKLSRGWTEAHAREESVSDDEQAHDQKGQGGRNLERDELAIRQNGGNTGTVDDGELADAEIDDGMDDDMMDKISSSPSIDDGWYISTLTWPPRSSSLTQLSTQTHQLFADSPTLSSPSCSTSSFFSSCPPLTKTPSNSLTQNHQSMPLESCIDSTCTAGFSSSPVSSSSSFHSTSLKLFPFSSQLPEKAVTPVNHHLERKYTRAIQDTTTTDPSLGFIHGGNPDTPWVPLEQDNNFPGSCNGDIKLTHEFHSWEHDRDNKASITSIQDNGIHNLLLPTNDPLLEQNTSDYSLDDTPFVNGIPLPAAMALVEKICSSNDETDSSIEVPADDIKYNGHSSPEMNGKNATNSFSPTGSDSSSSSWITTSEDGSTSWDAGCPQDDDLDGVTFSDDSRFIDSGWGGECLRETEDIDFEFVYALHTFVATVEGQANATKGDTMVLLDDSNSYWWLVRIVKDSSIGYLPAEHIETPTERLARLNKHRNIDLAATMLGDNAEKSKNPLKKAMRRRNAKNVQWSLTPTYVEASDYDYSSDEDEDTELFPTAEEGVDEKQETRETEQDDLKVEPLKLGAEKKDKKPESPEPTDKTQEPGEDDAETSAEKARTSDEIFERPLGAKVTRNGTLRNTDSFFKDENAETRKITLTPNLLRDDSSSSTVRTSDTRERGASLDSLEKNGSTSDKSKDDKKKKEKKPGMLSGLFKRKDKKSKTSQDLDASDEKISEEISRSSLQKDQDEGSPEHETQQQQLQRQTSKGKLQKSSKTKAAEPQVESPEPSSAKSNITAPSSMRIVSPEPEQQQAPDATIGGRMYSPEPDPNSPPRSNSVGSPTGRGNKISTMLRGQEQPKREKLKKAKQRVELDDFDEEKNGSSFTDPVEEINKPAPTQTRVQTHKQELTIERLSESPIAVSPLEEPDPHRLPALVGDTSSQEDRDVSPISPPSTPPPLASPANVSLANAPSQGSQQPLAPIKTSIPAQPSRPAPIPTEQISQSQQPPSPAPTSPSNSNSLPAWSDASLRSYLDDGTDIRDMLLVVHDVSGVVPVGPDHPIMAGLFQEERGKVADLGAQLDGLLGDWLEKKRLGRTVHPNARRRSGGGVSPKAGKPKASF